MKTITMDFVTYEEEKKINRIDGYDFALIDIRRILDGHSLDEPVYKNKKYYAIRERILKLLPNPDTGLSTPIPDCLKEGAKEALDAADAQAKDVCNALVKDLMNSFGVKI